MDLNQLFERMSAVKLDEYARNGTLPEWFTNFTALTTSEQSRNGGE